MKTLVLVTLAMTFGIPSFAQYSATSLTRKVVPQQPAPARPAQPQYAAPPRPAAPPRELTPEETSKVQVKQDKNEVKQFEFYKRRADEGSDDAQYQLGVRYLTGKGIAKDEKLGREWLGKAAKQGHSQASKKLAELGPETVGAATPTPSPTAAAKK
ncbi:MAG: tetratricopeptide repeat protein [Limisphaerales bacterium]